MENTVNDTQVSEVAEQPAPLQTDSPEEREAELREQQELAGSLEADIARIDSPETRQKLTGELSAVKSSLMSGQPVDRGVVDRLKRDVGDEQTRELMEKAGGAAVGLAALGALLPEVLKQVRAEGQALNGQNVTGGNEHSEGEFNELQHGTAITPEKQEELAKRPPPGAKNQPIDL